MDRATKFAYKVVNGIEVDNRTHFGKNEIACCKRHLYDLERQGTEEFPYVWDIERSKRRLSFAETLTLAEGKKGELIKLYEFQAFVKASQYGWIHKDTGYRRFRTSYVQVGRQNGKSLDNAENTIFYSNFDRYMYPQVYCVATKEAQAKIVLKEAIKFINADSDLASLFKVQEYKSLITGLNTQGEIRALGRDSKSIDGFRPYFGSVDELHLHKNNQMYKLMVDGCNWLDECLVSVITTAGFDLNSFCLELYNYCLKVIHRIHFDETQFVYIADMDKDDDYWDDSNWQKANPLWTDKRLTNLKASAIKAKEMGGEELRNFLTKSLNMWVQHTDTQYMNMEHWKNCGSDTTLEDMEGQECVIGIDLSSGGDLTSIAYEFNLIIDNQPKYFIHSHSFIPSNRVAEHIKTDKAPYDMWIREGLLTTTETLGGVKTDYKYIIARVKKDIEKYNLKIKAFAYDPHNADAFLNDLEEFGVDCIEIVQSCRSLNDATVDFKLEVEAGNIIYNRNNSLLNWCMANAQTVSNSFGEVKIDKNIQSKRIDPIDAIIDAHKIARSYKKEVSVYEQRGMRSLL